MLNCGMVYSAYWRTSKLSDEEFDDLWQGISLNNGHKLAHLLICYNMERACHHRRWEVALAVWESPLQLIWGLDDPVSGQHVLELATRMLPCAVVTEPDGVKSSIGERKFSLEGPDRDDAQDLYREF
jgi:hypothetical protein